MLLSTGTTHNIVTRLARAVDADATRARFAASIARIRQIAPESEACIESPTEIIFRLHGLEFARAKLAPVEGSFRNAETITFGLWPAEYTLDETKVARFRWSRASLSAVAPRATAAIRSSAFVRSAGSKR